MKSREEGSIQGGHQNPKEDLLKLRYDYAWKWFEYHANQRVTMFNYFLIITGILSNAYVGLLKEGLLEIAMALGSLGALTSVGFFLLDWRNKQLVDMGEDVLEKLEREKIFNGYKGKKGGEIFQLGFLFREEEEKLKLQGKPLRRLGTSLIKHKFWIRAIQGAVVILFVLATILPLRFKDKFQPRANKDISRLEIKVTKLEEMWGQKERGQHLKLDK
ncbi:MAG: RipA family octameric membrane protein [Planctomycetota bacterium]|jgi:hypothetical protein